MLARTPMTEQYLSAAELGITEQEREALLWVREELASGHIPRSKFNMCETGKESCGTVACIGGHMAIHLGMKPKKIDDFVIRDHDFSLEHLFFPSTGRWGSITPAQAVRAIDAWMTGHQRDCWTLALADEP